MVHAISSAAATVGKRRGIAVEIATLTRAAPVHLDATLVAHIAESARALGYSMMHMASGAGHDVQSVADLAHTGMIFVPSRGGISHAPEEYTAPDAILHGIRALAATWTDTTMRGVFAPSA
jgi:acetylornithine deacetylase/succinyl-diaminopimelate desuccinylase-like protein